MIETGRVCVKTVGREAGKFCVILDVLKDGFVLVTGPKAATTVKRRKCSIHHVEPTPVTVKIKKNASDDDVLAAYKQAGVFKKLGIKEPTAKEIEKARDAERKRLAKAKTEKAKPEAKKKEPEAEPKKAEEKPEAEKAAPAKKEPAKKKQEAKTVKKPAAKKAVKKTTKKAEPKKK
ncbi:MAG: 50S ribosomal protein L14e [Candidatus Aenigmarchaeota archaeon]|nr:50S ribosomal protein L14e [Candidatus Aenigmarchaeota archaeon]